jgi:hypothetical protein
MDNSNQLTLERVADQCQQAGFVLSHEGEQISAEDLYFICAQLENAQAALLTHANRIEREHAQG